MVVMVITDMAMERGRLRLDTIMDTMDMVDMVMVTDMARERLSQDTTTPTTMEVMVIMVMAMARGKLSPLLLLKLMPSLDTIIPTHTMVVMVITDMDMARGRLRLDTIMDTMDMVMDTMVKQQLFIC